MEGDQIETPFYVKYPFLIDSLTNNEGPYYLARVQSGFMVRLDMPGVSSNGLKISKDPEKRMVTFNGTAPMKTTFPYDLTERVYAGVIALNFDPSELSLKVFIRDGSVHLFFPEGLGQLRFIPKIVSGPGQTSSSGLGEGSFSASSEKSTLVFDGSLIVEDEGSEESQDREDSSSGKSIVQDEANDDPSRSHDERESDGGDVDNHEEGTKEISLGEENSTKIDDRESKNAAEEDNEIRTLLSLAYKCEASENSKQDERSPSEESDAEAEQMVTLLSMRRNCGGSEKFKQGEHSPSGKSVAEAEGSGKQPLDQQSFEKSVEDWIDASVKKNILGIVVPKRETPKGVTPETPKGVAPESEQLQSGHEPEVAIGSALECQLHKPQCKCGNCDSVGIYVRKWWTTDNTSPNNNLLKISGPNGFCEKRVTRQLKGFLLFVRADLPGLEKERCRVTYQDSCILVFGEPEPKEQLLQGSRNYLFYLKLRCPCCKFHDIHHDYEHGVFRLACQIIGKNDDSE